jgi:hypothetical protein
MLMSMGGSIQRKKTVPGQCCGLTLAFKKSSANLSRSIVTSHMLENVSHTTPGRQVLTRVGKRGQGQGQQKQFICQLLFTGPDLQQKLPREKCSVFIYYPLKHAEKMMVTEETPTMFYSPDK